MGRGFGVSASLGNDVVALVAQEAERAGYTSFWVNDLPRSSGLAALAAAASATEHIQLGVGVIPLDARPPAHIEREIVSTGLPVERLLLGVGSGGSQGALARVRAGVADLRNHIAGARIVVGALGPRMVALGLEVADGVLVNWVTPGFVPRSTTSALVSSYVRCGLTPGAAPRLRDELAHYVGVAPFEQHVERMGVAAEATCIVGPDAAALQAGIAAFDEVLDETIVRAVTPTDEPRDLLELLRACAPRASVGRSGGDDVEAQ